MDSYEKKYKEALERARNLRKDAIDMGENIRAKQCEIIFPELVESDDERIMKKICKLLWDNAPYEEAQEYIAWLEKQGVQKTVDEIAKEVCKDKASAVAFLKSAGIMNEKGELAEPYRQDEQRHTDKVEPKFKVGDWVVCEVTGSVYQIKNRIENLSNHKYGYDLTNGGYIGSDEVNHYHIWTIEDALDGD